MNDELFVDVENIMSIKYYLAKIRYKLHGNNYEIMNDYYRKSGAKIGHGVLICTNIAGNEACLIEIGNNTTISTDVAFVTHDFSVKNLGRGMNNIFGKVVVGNNCFIGCRAVLMYGVTLGDNIIVAAGSVVTHSFKEENVIIGGNPARVIGTWDSFYDKVKDKSLSYKNLAEIVREHPEKLVSRD